MENSIPLVLVKSEPMDAENDENNKENGVNQDTAELKEEEVWIKPEPQEEDTQDSSKEDQEIDTSAIKVEVKSEGPTLTNEDKQKLQLPFKKRRDKPLKKDPDEAEQTKEETEKNANEENAEQANIMEPKVETHLWYSYDVTKNIEIVTIDEEERQKEHQETMKSREHMRHVCEHCALGFVLEQAYLVHMKVHDPKSGDHECLLCHCRLKTADMLYRHRLRHYRRYRCLLCWTRFKDKDTAACHVMTEHVGESFECEHCGKGFKRPQYLKRHVEQYHTKPLSLACPVCGRVFHERGWYRSHVRTHNEEVRLKTVKKQELPVTCKICSRDFKNKASLSRHVLTHDEDVHCEVCYEKCKNRVTLRKHYLRMHNDKYSGTREQACPECNRICATPAMLRRHRQRMHSDRTKNFECDYCGRRYLTKGEVRAHIGWSHAPAHARGHACACGRVFRTPALRRQHVARVHHNTPAPRDHPCAVCGKAFQNKQVLNRHMKSHSDETYPCNECGLVFKTQPYVKVHYQLKHLNMTRAQINEQRKLNKNKIIQDNIDKSTNYEPPICDSKVEDIDDPLLVQDGEVVKPEDDIQVPMFQTFVDVLAE